jgi:hypothetical protein
MTKLVVSVRNFANAPKKKPIVRRYITTYDANKASLDKTKHQKTKRNTQHRSRFGPHIPRFSTGFVTVPDIYENLIRLFNENANTNIQSVIAK